MNGRLELLAAYPFERLARLKAASRRPPRCRTSPCPSASPNTRRRRSSSKRCGANLAKLDSYPVTAGLPEMRAACAAWLERRFKVRVSPDTMVLPVNGTREALFSFVQAVVSTGGTQSKPVVAMPNPFYQIYEGAALLAGAEPVFLNTTSRQSLSAGSRRRAGRDLEALRDPVPLQSWQSHRSGTVARVPAPRTQTRGEVRLRDRVRRVLRGAVSRRELSASFAAAGGAGRRQ